SIGLKLPFNVIRMKDENGKEMLVATGKELGYGGFGTALEAYALTGSHAGRRFALKRQRLPTLARKNFFKRLKQVSKRSLMESPKEDIETQLLRLQGDYFGEAAVVYTTGAVATAEEARPDPREHQWFKEKTKSRYYVLQTF